MRLGKIAAVTAATGGLPVLAVAAGVATVVAFGETTDADTGPGLALTASDCGGPTVTAAAPVAELTDAQMRNAAVVVQTITDEGLGERAAVIALATALTESGLRDGLDESRSDRDSAGWFQQRRPWGPLEDRMDGRKSTLMFLHGGATGQPGLLDKTGWDDESRPVWEVAQSVQVSAFPTAYAKWEPAARAATAALLDGATTTPARDCDPEPATAGGLVAAGKWTAPVDATPNSEYGYRIHPVYGTRKLHGGLDFAAPCDTTPIRAAAAGTVVLAARHSSWGNYVVVDHGGGVRTLYAHQADLRVEEGDRLAGGQPLGVIGTTGTSTGCHLHLEVRTGASSGADLGDRTDPRPWLTDRGVSL